MDILKAYTSNGKHLLVDEHSIVRNWTTEMSFEMNLIFSLSLGDGNDLALLRNLRNIASTELLSVDSRIFAIYKFYELIAELFDYKERELPSAMQEIPGMFFEMSSILSQIKVHLHRRFFDLVQYIFQCCMFGLYNNRHLDIDLLYVILSAQENTELVNSRYSLMKVAPSVLEKLLHYKKTDPSQVLSASLEIFRFCKQENLHQKDNFRFRFAYFVKQFTREYLNDPKLCEEYTAFFREMDHHFFNYNTYLYIAENYCSMCKRFSRRPEVEFFRLTSKDKSFLERKYPFHQITSPQFMKKGYEASERAKLAEQTYSNIDLFIMLSDKAIHLTNQYIGTLKHREIIATGLDKIKATIQRRHPGASFKLYGSCQLETWTKYSSIDLTIKVENWWEIQASLGQIQEASVERYNNVAMKLVFEDCVFIITVNDNIGLATSQLFKQYLSLNSKATALILFVKIWAKTQELLSPNGLSGFHITLLVIHFFQFKGILPTLQNEEHEPILVDGFDTWFSHSSLFKATNDWSFGFLILMFFEHYANDFYLDGKIHICDLKLGTLIEESTDSLFAAKHPFTNAIIGHKIKLGTSKANEILSKFQEAYELLIRGKDLIVEHLQS